MSGPSFQPMAVHPGDITVVTKTRPTNNRNRERDDMVYVPYIQVTTNHISRLLKK
jgi:hypothetical protein